MANFTVLDWQGKEAGETSIDLKTAKESSAADLLHRAVYVNKLTAVKVLQVL